MLIGFNIIELLTSTVKIKKGIMKYMILHDYTVITFARFLGWSGLYSFSTVTWYARS